MTHTPALSPTEIARFAKRIGSELHHPHPNCGGTHLFFRGKTLQNEVVEISLAKIVENQNRPAEYAAEVVAKWDEKERKERDADARRT